MILYAYILVCAEVFLVSFNLVRMNEDKAKNHMYNLIFYVPIIGRFVGWW